MLYNVQHSYFFFSCTYINSFVGIPIRKQAKYNWAYEKHGFSRLMPQILSDCPCDFFYRYCKWHGVRNQRNPWNQKVFACVLPFKNCGFDDVVH